MWDSNSYSHFFLCLFPPLSLSLVFSVMKVYCDENKVSHKRGLESMLAYPVGAVARAQRELCWNDWIYYPNSKNRRLGPRRVSYLVRKIII